jgi:predicted Zn finger-like uncharacterized protein|tara:strand:+ start:125 stop:574 length:450 start_codon:yes stop_codon:yes gene_type:complete
MIITCPDCNKNFDVDKNLIPAHGRLLQCGSCNYKWFFELKINKENFDEEIKSTKNELPVDTETIIHEAEATLEKNITTESTITKNNYERKNINYLKILLVIVISIVAFIIIMDTFKDLLTSVFPNIDFLLNNLYQSIEDMKLFIIDLIK